MCVLFVRFSKMCQHNFKSFSHSFIKMNLNNLLGEDALFVFKIVCDFSRDNYNYVVRE